MGNSGGCAGRRNGKSKMRSDKTFSPIFLREASKARFWLNSTSVGVWKSSLMPLKEDIAEKKDTKEYPLTETLTTSFELQR